MDYGLYIHIPFCRKKCPYCSFVSIPGGETLFEPYAAALTRELDSRMSGVFSGTPRTVYIGGGTPSIFPTALLREILAHRIGDAAEVTVEANPDSIDSRWLESVRDAGVNRISIGVQSLDDRILENLGRLHTAARAHRAVRLAQAAGFRSVSIDLMFGVPGQTVETWKRTLDDALELGVDHISAYSLTIEEDTPFLERSGSGGLALPEAEETVGMYAFLSETLASAGFRRYEISNFARPGHECLHNQGYWTFAPYLGAGAAAHSFDGISRRWNTAGPPEYIESACAGIDPIGGSETIDIRKRATEELMLSLRLNSGLDIDDYATRYAIPANQIKDKIAPFIREGILEYDENNRICITTKGVMLIDEILVEMDDR